MIRVLDFATTSQGAFRLLRTRVRKVDALEGFENDIVCPEGPWTDLMREEGVRVQPLPMRRTVSVLGSILEWVAAYRLLCQERPEIIHTHNSKAGALVRVAAWTFNLLHRHRIVIIHQVHGFHFTHLTGIRARVFLLIEMILAFLTDCLLFQNRFEYDLAQRHMRTQIRYIGNGVSFDELSPYMSAERTPGTPIKTIVCVARIEPVKNHQMLVEALSVLKDKYRYNSFRAVLIGEGEPTHLEPLIGLHGLADHIEFTGSLDRSDVLCRLRGADLSVLTSQKEGKPRALIESMVLSVPCLATDVIGTNEVVVDGYNGFLVELGDCDGFAKQAHRLFSDDALWRDVSRNARRYAEENFDEDVVVGKIVDAYKALLDAKGKGLT